MQKPNIFLKCGCKVGAGCGSACLPFGVSTGVGVQAFGVILSSCGVFPPFCPLCRFMLVLSLANMALFRFLRRF